MKKNSIKLLIIGTAFASVLSGCGDGSKGILKIF